MNQAFTNPAPVTVIGHFDGMENGLAVGWAFDPTKPGHRLQVEVMCGNEVVAFGMADQFRDDLRPAGIGDGKHLFRLPVSYELLDGKTYELTAREASTGLALNGDPVLFAAAGKKSDLALIDRKQGLAILTRILARPASQKPARNATTFIKLYRIGALAQETGRLDDALYAWDTLNKELGENALCRCKLGETYLLQGAAEAALDEYKAAAAADLSLYWSHLGIAQSSLLLGRHHEAEEALKVASALSPDDAFIAKRLENVRAIRLSRCVDDLISDGKREQAIQVLKDAVYGNPLDRKSVEKLGDILIMTESLESAHPENGRIKQLMRTQRTLEFFLNDMKDR